MQTETPILDDNGDGRGTALKDYDTIREGGKAQREPDGSLAKRWSLVLSPAEQSIPPDIRQKRNVLETQIDALRAQRAELEDEDYYKELEGLALQIADLYQTLEEVDSPSIEKEEEVATLPGDSPSATALPEVEKAEGSND